MPIYGYRCTECGHELEVRQSMSDEPLRVCAECGGALRKLLYPVGVQFKGSGFYTTDYKNGGSGGQGSKSGSNGESSSSGSNSNGSSSTSGESSSGGSSEKKTETKSETSAS
jgi:putative FmdB family regulatory protein